MTKKRAKYIRRVSDLDQLSSPEKLELKPVEDKYVFRANEYYLNLIDWDDANDPIRQLIIPRSDELDEWGRLDASNEEAYTVARGTQHKYRDTVLLLCNEVCGAYCRYCFRKRLFMDDNDEVSNDVTDGINYIKDHPEVSNVLLTGGDPLLMSPRRICEILDQLAEIPHVRIVRFGSKIPAFDPDRVLSDELQDVFRKHTSSDKRLYLMAHFDHPRELTEKAIDAVDTSLRNGVICVNQCPIIRGVNDNSADLSELFSLLSHIGCPQYYLFQGRPTAGNKAYEVPIVDAWQIFQKALASGSGLARRCRFVMSHETGKVEILAIDSSRIYLRYHQSHTDENAGRFFICQRDDQAGWLDDLIELTDLENR